MSTHQLTGSDLREAVFEIVGRELGPAALVRYIAENFSQAGTDYTEERRLRPSASVEEIAAGIAALKAKRGGSLAPADAKIVAAPDETKSKPKKKP